MNIQPGNSPRRKPERTAPVENAGLSELLSLVTRVCQFTLAGIVFGAFLYAYITLDNRIGHCQDMIREAKTRSKQYDRMILALRSKEAAYSRREFVMAQVRHFRLPLVQTRYRQIRTMSVLSADQAARTPLAGGILSATASNRSRQ